MFKLYRLIILMKGFIMRKTLFVFILFLIFCTVEASQLWAAVDWQIGNTIQFNETPDDFAISRNGKWSFILTDAGDILIYGINGDLKDKVHVGTHINKILAGPRDNILIISSKKNKTAQLVYFRVPEIINIQGAPFMGAPDAPVEIVVFSDFQ